MSWAPLGFGDGAGAEVIDEELFNQAREARRENLASWRGRKERLITTLFYGSPTGAYCGVP